MEENKRITIWEALYRAMKIFEEIELDEEDEK